MHACLIQACWLVYNNVTERKKLFLFLPRFFLHIFFCNTSFFEKGFSAFAGHLNVTYVCVSFNKSYKLYPALCIKQSKYSTKRLFWFTNSVAHWGCQQHLWGWLLLCESVGVWHVNTPLLFHLFFRHAQEIAPFFFSLILLLDFYSIRFYS